MLRNSGFPGSTTPKSRFEEALVTRTEHFLLAALHQKHHLWSDAIAQLATLNQPPSAIVAQRLGELYLAVELYDLAETRYTAALSLAEAGDQATNEGSPGYQREMHYDETPRFLKLFPL